MSSTVAQLFANITSIKSPPKIHRHRIPSLIRNMLKTLDIRKIRSETPGCSHKIHFNNAGSSLSPQSVTDAVISYLTREQEVGGYEAAEEAKYLLNSFYVKFAELLNCDESEIAFIENSTRAWELAVHSIKWAHGDQIITAENEYGSNYLGLLHIAKRKSLDLITVPCDEFGVVSLNQLEKSITSKTKLIALTHIASQRGDIQPATAVGAIAKKNNVIFLLDACQSAGQINLDTKELRCDFLCGSGRKYLRGPRGTGFLFVNNKILQSLEPIFLDLHSASWRDSNSYEFVKTARMFECYERNVAAMIGLSTAVQYLSKLGINAIEERTSHLSSSLIAGLSELQGIRVLEKSHHRSGIITFTKDNIDAKILRDELKKRNISVSVCKQKNSQLDLGTELIGDVTRVSLHYYNTQDEISEFLQALEEIS